MSTQEKAVITVGGKNAIGILAKVATCAAEANTNVIQVSQIVMDEIFTMSMLVDISEMKGSIQDLENAIKDHLPGIEIHVMHENIFNSMHTI